ncbi:acyl-CoA carboxylase epsilon subunit [Streptomyces hoynatensis]|uniref:Acyl-CoA carboxylase subunit epsilon n=1 Tax=Streptomyces hoynatensis TaxID=1141874 RepID=A0A3A9ZHT9_9ACTN|nr:acyl-CoA carboxylase epsilon subunit [Streptomyces hoynatensis]RKN47264.1 acyl-CoA carboxylase subunit epsilon [Streptomyces hoynatensis]
MIRIVRGNPTPEELAAAVAVVQARVAAAAGAEATSRQARIPAWSDPARNVPRPLPAPAPGAWRTSYWPAGA